jgi:hypothetical protein
VEPNQLIFAAATGAHQLTHEELRQIIEHIAEAGFEPSVRERVRGRLAGMLWQGQVLHGTDTLLPAEVHYLWHVIKR